MLYGALLPIQAIRFKNSLCIYCFMFYACLILLYVFISGILCNAVIRNKRIHFTTYVPNFIEIGRKIFLKVTEVWSSSESRDTKTRTNIKNPARSNLDIVL